MDFILALTHFCEKHGPKSVLCTQVLPLECTLCVPPRQRRERRGSYESYTTQIGKEDEQEETVGPPRLRRTSTDLTLPPALSKASAAGETQLAGSRIEEHAYFQPNEAQKAISKYPYSQQHVEICASCSFTVPQQVAAKLPEGAPGSLPKDGSRNPSSAPVLRSREFVCLGNKRRARGKDEAGSSQESQGTSVESFESSTSHTNCHDHTLTYLTSKSPYAPESFATLRQSVLRALSGEQLPHGMSEGPFCFGDSTSGYTIAYSFRLTDPKARGRVRRYAFVALAGNDTYRAFKACPMLWEAFALMSKIIEQAAQRYQDEQEQQQQRERDEQMAQDAKSGYTNISSFLTQRPRDADGYPRRVGQTVPMNLAEIIGDENIFAVLHQYFVHVLRRLGDKFGGLPVADAKKMVYQTTCNDHEQVGEESESVKVCADMMADMTMEQDEPAAKQHKDKQSVRSSTAGSKPANSTNKPNNSTRTSTTSPTKPSTRLITTSATMTGPPPQTKKSPQCGPISAEKPMQRRVAV